MSFNWFALKRNIGKRNLPRSGDRGHRRSLAMERLEDRSLLSVNLPMSLAPATAFYAPLFPGQSTTDVATQILVVMPQNVPNGAPVNVGLMALDAQDHPVSTFSDTADITTSDSDATLSASSVAFKGGFASLQMTFATSGSQTVTATDVKAPSLAGSGATNVGAVDVATHFALTLPPIVGEGRGVNVHVVALDAQNHVVLSYQGTDTVAAGDKAATLSATSLTFSGGTASFQATFGTLESQTLTVANNNSSITGAATTTVTAPAVATHFAVQLPPNVPDGVPVNAALVALDANNHPVPGYSGTASLSTSDANGSLSATSVTLQNGIAAFQATFATSGTQTVTATDANNSTLAGTGSTNVGTPDVATHFLVQMPANSPNGLIWMPVLVEPMDANNLPVPTYTGTVNLTTSDSKATLPFASMTVKPGAPTSFTAFVVMFATGGVQTVTATDSENSSLTGTASTNVAPGDVATHFEFQLPPNAVPTGSPVWFGVVALDAKNLPVVNYSGSVIIGSSDGSATLPKGPIAVGFGVGSFQVTFATVGSQTLTVTDESDSSVTSTTKIQVVLPLKMPTLPQ